jgi:O-succinylbenzoic acid--CoA ligase
MMLVRAVMNLMEVLIREPSGHPLKEKSPRVEFAAMTPMQVYNSLQSAEERRRLKSIKKLLIGGSAIDAELEKKLRRFPGEVYMSYGMTETLSHIALRRISGTEASDYYTPFPSVRLSLSERGTLVIDAPLVCDEILETNDLAEIRADGTFRILGRIDNVINSGGIKIHAEELENELRAVISINFAITSVPDPQLGEAVVLLVEDEKRYPSFSFKSLPAHRRPRYVLRTGCIPVTGNGKTDRSACKKLARLLLKI